jgi:hypothetical protein
MANLEQVLELITMLAAEDMSAAQYRFVTVNSSGNAALASAGGEVEGVNQEAPASGEATVIAVAGISFVEVGTGGITAGAKVASDASGKAVAVGSGAAAVGKAMSTASAGELVAVLLQSKAANTVDEVIKVSLVAAADLTAKQGSAVVVDTSGTLAVAGAAAFALGILLNAPDIGEEALVAVMGKASGIAGEALTAGDVLTTDATGRLVDATAGDPACGICLVDAAAADDAVSIVVVGRGVELIV